MLPEISRRCMSCGAAVRAGARFCPQCGQAFGEAGQSQTPSKSADAAGEHGQSVGTSEKGIESLAARLSASLTEGGAPNTRDAQLMQDDAPPTRDVYLSAHEDEMPVGREGVVESGAVGAAPSSQGEAGAIAPAASAIEGEADEASAGDGLGRVARARENARVRVESTKVRVGKMRDEALVVLEETPDDSGLRFVLVAVAAFLLFVIFLFFSTSVLR